MSPSCGERGAALLRPTARPAILAVLNASPESFHAGSVAATQEAVRGFVRAAEAAGAHAIDIGAMSTAPYKDAWIDPQEEQARMVAAVSAARGATALPITADTQRAAVARAALEAGADALNDVTALLGDPAMGSVAAETGVPLILMANDAEGLAEEGTPEATVLRLLHEAVARAARFGIPTDRLILDPGIGFFRRRSVPWHAWDLAVLRHLGWLQERLPAPLLLGASRKSLFGPLLGRQRPEERLAASLAVASWAARAGVAWLRVHDVAETRDVLWMEELLQRPD